MTTREGNVISNVSLFTPWRRGYYDHQRGERDLKRLAVYPATKGML